MKISVIIPNFEDMRIKRAVDSLKYQSYSNYEIIIIDGGSKKKELLDYYKESKVDSIFIDEDDGIFDALNKGINKSSGDVIFLMGADDELSDSKVFEMVLDSFEKSNPDGICIGCKFVDNHDVIREWIPKKVTKTRMRFGILPPHFSLFLKRDFYTSIGLFKYKKYGNIACDTIWLMDLAMFHDNFHIEMLGSVHLRMEYGGASTGSLSAIFKQFIVVHRYAMENSLVLPLPYFYSLIRSLSKISQLRLSFFKG